MVEIALTKRQLQMLVAHRHVSRHAPGQVLFYRDHRPAGVWVVARGELALRENGHTIAYVIAPAIVGLKQLLSATPYPYTAQTMTATDTVFIGKEELGGELDRPPIVEMLPAIGVK